MLAKKKLHQFHGISMYNKAVVMSRFFQKERRRFLSFCGGGIVELLM